MAVRGQVSMPSPLVLGIFSLIRAANEVEAQQNPRVAYLCRFHALQKAERLDPTATGPGPKFKAALLQRLEKDDLRTLNRRVHSADAREMEHFYGEYNSRYIQQKLRTPSAPSKDELVRVVGMHQTAAALFEVLKELSSPSPQVDQVLEAVPTGLRNRHRHRRRHGSQEHVVTRCAAERGGGGSKASGSSTINAVKCPLQLSGGITTVRGT